MGRAGRECTMKGFLTPLMPVLLVLLHPDASFSSTCPKDCTCSPADSTMCYQRRSSSIPTGVSSSTKNLYLFSNGIESLNTDDFRGMEKLEMLDLSQNKLTELPDRVFEPLYSLRNLDLSSNQISHISEKSFQGLALLERLYIYSNHIATIHPAAFDGMEHLLELKLQGNMLTSIPTLTMPRLLLLDLRFNHLPTLGRVGLTRLDTELISNLKNLHELDISANQLETFPPVNNPMGPLNVQDLQNLSELQELDISSLSLQSLPEEFSQYFPHLNKLTIAENPFNCLCTLAWFPRWLRAQSVTLERTEETRCHFPPVIAGRVLERLDHRDFGCPTTTTVTTSTAKTTTLKSVPVTTTRNEKTVVNENDDGSLPRIITSPDTKEDPEEMHFCPSDTCLNGGTCHLVGIGQIECMCPRGFTGLYCEIYTKPAPPPEPVNPQPTVTVDTPDISSHQATPTSILLDLHRYFELRPKTRAIRLTYRNLSGPDRRPMQLNLPASHPEYVLRGLKPNSTYAVCASPLGAPSVLVAVAVGVMCYLRKKKGKGHLELECEPSQLELEGVKAGADNGALPQKQPQIMIPEPAVQNGNVEDLQTSGYHQPSPHCPLCPHASE
ncbi:hypothetical protein WMY93_003152 [Mugilogobius chulae]|uniref:EGF-like domain-containing protein n=1 Tax=Mugilogobius chulae TaxID=88201 RepID=A0AAW0Q1K5_9GOBI